MAQVIQLRYDERTSLNNKMRELAIELCMQGKLLAYLDPSRSLNLTGQATGLLIACSMIMEDNDA